METVAHHCGKPRRLRNARVLSDARNRAVVFIALGCSGFAPIIHAFLQYGFGGLENFPTSYINLSSLLYLTGTTFYVTRTPEKIWPGVFDVWVGGNVRSPMNA